MTKAEQIIRTALIKIKLRSLRELAVKVGIPRSTLHRKAKYPETLTAQEIKLIATKTNMTKDEVYDLIMSV